MRLRTLAFATFLVLAVADWRLCFLALMTATRRGESDILGVWISNGYDRIFVSFLDEPSMISPTGRTPLISKTIRTTCIISVVIAPRKISDYRQQFYFMTSARYCIYIQIPTRHLSGESCDKGRALVSIVDGRYAQAWLRPVPTWFSLSVARNLRSRGHTEDRSTFLNTSASDGRVIITEPRSKLIHPRSTKRKECASGVRWGVGEGVQ